MTLTLFAFPVINQDKKKGVQLGQGELISVRAHAMSNL